MKKVVSYEDFMNIPPGATRVFPCGTGACMDSARSTGYQMPKKHPREDVERYKIVPDWDDFTLTVTAIARTK